MTIVESISVCYAHSRSRDCAALVQYRYPLAPVFSLSLSPKSLALSPVFSIGTKFHSEIEEIPANRRGTCKICSAAFAEFATYFTTLWEHGTRFTISFPESPPIAGG